MRKQQRKARDGCSGKAPIAPQAACESLLMRPRFWKRSKGWPPMTPL